MEIINSEKNLFKNWTDSIYALIKDEKRMLSSEILFLTCSGFDIVNNTNSSLSSQETLEKIFHYSKKYRITDLVFESSLYLISSLKILKEIYISSLLESAILLKKKLSDYVIYIVISNRKFFNLSISYKLIDYYIEFDLFQEYKELIISLRLENPKLIGPLSRPYSDSYNYFELDHSLSTLYFSSNNKEEFSRIKNSYNIKNSFQKAVENASPSVEVKSRRIGGATYQVPIEVPRSRRFYLASQWIINAAQSRSGRPMADNLASELISAANGDGGAIKKKDDTHRMAEANKAFAHFR